MTERHRQQGLLAWAHLYFLFTFYWWYGWQGSFSAQGLQTMQALPVWSLEWLPRLPQTAIPWFLEMLALASLAGAFLSFRHETLDASRKLLIPLFLGKFYLYLLDLRLFTTFHHMHLFIVLLLLCRARMFLLQLGLIWIYFFSFAGKLNDSWLEGRYFQSMGEGLPFLGSSPSLLLAASWSVLILEALGPLAWFSRSLHLRRFSLGCFLAFHLYSGFIVGFPYPLLTLPLVGLLLWPLDQPLEFSLHREARDTPSLVVLAMSFLLCFAPYLIQSDQRYTAEGRYFSFGNMFDGNRRVRFQAQFETPSGPTLVTVLRDYPETGFYDASTVVMSSVGNRPFENAYESMKLSDSVSMKPDYFTQTHVRIIGDPHLYLSFLKRVSGEVNATRVEASLETGLNGEGWKTVFHFDGRPEELPVFRPLAKNEWLLP